MDCNNNCFNLSKTQNSDFINIYEQMIVDCNKDIENIDELLIKNRQEKKKNHTFAELTKIEKQWVVLQGMKFDLIFRVNQIRKKLKRL